MVTPDAINELMARLWPTSNCSCLEVGEREALARLTPGEIAIRPGGFISGPTMFAVADAALWFLVMGCFAELPAILLRVRTPISQNARRSLRTHADLSERTHRSERLS
jgi:hypothetical protein